MRSSVSSICPNQARIDSDMKKTANELVRFSVWSSMYLVAIDKNVQPKLGHIR